MQSFGHKLVILSQSKLRFLYEKNVITKVTRSTYQIGLTHFRHQEAVFQWWNLFGPIKKLLNFKVQHIENNPTSWQQAWHVNLTSQT